MVKEVIKMCRKEKKELEKLSQRVFMLAVENQRLSLENAYLKKELKELQERLSADDGKLTN